MSFGGNWPIDGRGRKRARPVVDCSNEVNMTKQASRDEVDVNKIMARFEKTGLMSHVNGDEPFYGDVSEYSGLQDALIKVQEANELFMGYPASIRERFDNDPVKFVEFFEDPANLQEAIELGLAVKRPEVAPEASPAPVVPPV